MRWSIFQCKSIALLQSPLFMVITYISQVEDIVGEKAIRLWFVYIAHTCQHRYHLCHAKCNYASYGWIITKISTNNLKHILSTSWDFYYVLSINKIQTNKKPLIYARVCVCACVDVMCNLCIFWEEFWERWNDI